MFWILLGIGLAIFIYYVLAKPLKYWTERGVSQYQWWITWREILLDFIPYRTITEGIQRMYNEFPDNRYLGMYQFYTPTFVVRDTDLIKQVLVKDFDHFVDHFQFFPEGTEPLWEKNLALLNGEKWRDMRTTVSPSFTSSKMKIMFGLISDCAKRFVNYFEEQNLKISTVEMKDAFTRFTNDVIASTAFGVVCDSMRDRNNDFYVTGGKITNFDGFLNNLKFLCILMVPKFSKILGIKLFDHKINAFFQKLMKDNIQIREKEGIVRPDLIHLLMEARKGRTKHESVDDKPSTTKEGKHQKVLTDEDITAQALLFFFAGLDSVSTLMSFMAHELAVNPEIQKRLQDEVDQTLRACEGSLTYEALSKMKYMDMVVSESLRKWPPTVIMDRVCTKPYTIPSLKDGEQAVTLREGMIIWIPVYGLHRDPELFPEPERFDPERFSDENKSGVVPYSFIPFGSGPRNCIGNRFALMETKLIFFHILTKFDITVVEKTAVPLKMAKSQFQLNAEGGFWLGLKPR